MSDMSLISKNKCNLSLSLTQLWGQWQFQLQLIGVNSTSTSTAAEFQSHSQWVSQSQSMYVNVTGDWTVRPYYIAPITNDTNVNSKLDNVTAMDNTWQPWNSKWRNAVWPCAKVDGLLANMEVVLVCHPFSSTKMWWNLWGPTQTLDHLHLPVTTLRHSPTWVRARYDRMRVAQSNPTVLQWRQLVLYHIISLSNHYQKYNI